MIGYIGGIFLLSSYRPTVIHYKDYCKKVSENFTQIYKLMSVIYQTLLDLSAPHGSNLNVLWTYYWLSCVSLIVVHEFWFCASVFCRYSCNVWTFGYFSLISLMLYNLVLQVYALLDSRALKWSIDVAVWWFNPIPHHLSPPFSSG